MPAFAKRMEYMVGSAAIIRGLFGAMNDPETISFGGGAPASDALPVEQIHGLQAAVHNENIISGRQNALWCQQFFRNNLTQLLDSLDGTVL